MGYQRKKEKKNIFEKLSQAIAKLKKDFKLPFLGNNWNDRYANERPPLREELFSEEQLENYAKVLAKTHTAVYERTSESLLKRLSENEKVLLEVHQLLTESVKENKRIVPAGEWLLDNFYLIEEQIYTAEKHLPKGYSKVLPRLSKGQSANLPRVYDVAVEIISHTDGRIDLKSLLSFIKAYQTEVTLKLGELWAIPIMLRLALLENLRRLAIQIAIDIRNKDLASSWADKMTEIAEVDSKNLVLIIADMVRSDPPIVSSFVAELTKRLQEKGTLLMLPLSWIEQRLSENATTSSELIHQENQKQAADQVSISNSINSLRFLGANDWREFVENTSAIEQILRQDNNGVYGNMDFYTRDNYRHVIEKIARGTDMSEEAVALTVIQLTQANAQHGKANDRTAHVGYYLIGKGLLLLEKMVKFKGSIIEYFRKAFNKRPLTFYAGTIILFSFIISGLLIAKAYAEGLGNWILLAVLGVTSVIAISQLVISLLNRFITMFVPPVLLPRMDFSRGIPEQYRTLVVIPVILNHISEIEELIEGLEIRFLANRNKNLHFGLLTDFKDAASEVLPEDAAFVKLATERIIELNKKYGSNNNDLFFLFHRPRRWNASEKVWMGYERKRGKLAELNSLLRGKCHDRFSVVVGDETIFPYVKYVITLDADTQLPRDAAWKMIGTIAHPFNQAVFSEDSQTVIEGYAILQPKVSDSLHAINSSIYARLYQNETGLDPYTKAVSDIYQDLFGEGSFIGKGIYDVDIFEKILGTRFPENRILSHDLLEGCHVRSGLISDVQLYEEYPSRYLVDMKRRHRWIRGDWQIASWFHAYVPTAKKYFYQKNPLSLLSRWKIFDNIRRSLVPLSLLLLLFFGWLISADPFFWTLSVVSIMVLPSLVSLCSELIKKPGDVLFWPHILFSFKSAGNHFFQHVFEFICLPFEVYFNLDAIIRTNWRMSVTQKKMLEWNPSGNALRNNNQNIPETYKIMWFPVFLSIVLFTYLMLFSTEVLFVVMPILILWALSPFVSWKISTPLVKHKAELTIEQKKQLRKLARRIWGFFQNFVGEKDNWLPPDNYQEEPVGRIAHRTSPTNIGLLLLSNLSAFKFGYVTIQDFIHLTNNTIATMLKMERYKGHLYNWYDTETLQPLNPRYISTVDSGNLAGYLMVLKQGLIALPENAIFSEKLFDGLLDSVSVYREKITDNASLKQYENELINICKTGFTNIADIKKYVDTATVSFEKILNTSADDPANNSHWWGQCILKQLKDISYDLNAFAPWLAFPAPGPAFNKIIAALSHNITLQDLVRSETNTLLLIDSYYLQDNTKEENEWLGIIKAGYIASIDQAKNLMGIIEDLIEDCEVLSDMEFDFLYDRTQHLLSIGFNIDEHKRDHGFYDLLASEARLSTFVGIAQGKLPQDSWFALGRQITNLGVKGVLLSWSGSMFEYLMPSLIMPAYENTLLEETNKAIIQKQIEYGEKHGVPWGISESGYNLVDANLNYQYRAFGVPGLGFKRGLGEDLVVSPYSSIMSLMIDVKSSYQNFEKLKEAGLEGRFGFYEAIDYTASRLPRGKSGAVIKSFMAHHQGMSLLSLAFVLLDQPLQKLFESEIRFKATLLLLQERVPRISTFYSPSVHIADTGGLPSTDEVPIRVINTPDTVIPEVQLLSNGRYHTVVTNAGGGYSRWKDIAITRWREDTTCDNWGAFCFIHDLDNDSVWSTAFQPTLTAGENYEAVFSQGRAEFRRRDMSLETHTEIVVSPEDDIELRRIHITNRSRKRRNIEITSYAEVVLTSAVADEIHPAFSNLFVQTEINQQRHAIVCTRRPRSDEEHMPYMFHLMKVHDAEVQQVSYETDRAKFIGRGNTINEPAAMKKNGALSNTEGAVLDPIISIRYKIVLEPYEVTTIDLINGIAENKEICNGLIEKYQDQNLTNRVLELAWTHSQVILRQINAMESDAQLYCRLASSIVFSNSLLRADPAVIIKNHRTQSGLWGYSVSGDLPIVLVQIEDAANVDLVKQMVQAHTYWRLKGLMVDLVIWNEDRGGYRQVLQNQILGFVAPGFGADIKEQPGGIFIRSADQISNEDRILFQTVSHIVISDTLGSLEEQMNSRTKLKGAIPYFNPANNYAEVFTSVEPKTDLQFFNGTGGFSKDGSEYVITTTSLQQTPAPWVNVLANKHFGSIISENGQSYTWVENAHELRLTPWNNDAVGDLKGEAFYLRDEESGKYWSPTSLPSRGKSPYITRHGFGYSIFEHSEDGVYSEMCVYVDIEASIKFIRLRVKNNSDRKRFLSATGYVEWVLGDMRRKTTMHIVTGIDVDSGAIFAKNAYNAELENRVAFFDVDDTVKTYTTDRAEFIGRNKTINNPDAMIRTRLSGKKGAAIDPCGAIQVQFNLTENEEREVIFRLGVGRDADDASIMARQFKGGAAANTALEKVRNYWRKTVGAVQIETPDAAINIITNGWLNYQTIASRIWARSGFYQSGGAYGFRDQLQDVLSLLHTQPLLARSQILLCASRQFKEGDVQHWWHPPMGRGVRTTCSDDYLWLPFVTSRYLKITGDITVLDEQIHFIEGRGLNVAEESYYDLPLQSDNIASLYQHCVKAIERGLNFGEHGLPFIGSGDWNDGMDKVGNHGKGESVWLAFFLYDILNRFSEVAQIKNDLLFVDKCKLHADQLYNNISKNAWDGEWYRRAYFDNGSPLGSAMNDECKIDSIAQSWSVLSKGADIQHTTIAMASANKYLVREEENIVQLFDPPFDQSSMNPGYIKGYVPGVRENGGQYTHAAIWLAMAFAELGDKKKAWQLLQMINPVNHGDDAQKIAVYKVEPYVMSADIYAQSLHLGRGGWTWYTGSAGWMYQFIIESFIGLKKIGNKLMFTPCVPVEWKSLKIDYRYQDTLYHITYNQMGSEVIKLFLDEVEQLDHIVLVDNNNEHHISVMF
ncbi:cyclic beta 1-2 glucan synthetase [Ferruginibacter lapsinanis]|uniref:glycoside hydrolase family 94 protein n=1 Tax=Ferruginibacter lapsinanis TaxID=563172 RepID=UPI001E477640|nr:glycoside hydrolase family 94 protein [Ferruginibacter lapsinanis]UEG49105.1 cyclic beta 1-2 glucan synthetase [Ferruginibacter lapsinanis]